MNTRRKNFKLLAIIFGLLLMLTACESASSTETATGENKETNSEKTGKVIRLGYQKGNTLNILKESRFLEKKLQEDGYEIEWKEFNGGGPLLEALFTGNIDFGHASDGATIFAQAGNKPFVYVGADLPNPEGVGVLVHKDSDIKSIADLKGKRIGVSKGGNHHYLTILALKEAGISLDDVEWVYLSDAAQGRTAFETKKLDAFATYDPFLAGTEIQLDTINLTEGIDYGYPNRTFYVANIKFNEANPELVNKIIEAIDESDEWANKNKPEVVKLVSAMLGIEEKIIDRATARRDYNAEKMSQEIIDAQQKQADVYHEIGLIPEKIDVSQNVGK
ncbi:aliphatic sulfonate ABC transporter substrate-binding protein [Bacillus sp. FJAT-29937]|uniref:aliphatic sulfonate ABC transporter substrate-binding protein n=1 Tax=Bacillus sp. FJAT-29937 TaxID=1720553 RepID=UPI0009ECB127|nr:aliphatic sulfonate ABC transporter substrate-binding protein [Bacillus sp. FJAT-29937]